MARNCSRLGVPKARMISLAVSPYEHRETGTSPGISAGSMNGFKSHGKLVGIDIPVSWILWGFSCDESVLDLFSAPPPPPKKMVRGLEGKSFILLPKKTVLE